MAKIKARKEYKGTNKLLCALILFAFVCIAVVSIFSDSLTAVNPHKVRVPQNIKLIEPATSMNSLFKESEVIYIGKEPNGKIKNTDELVLVKDGAKPKISIFDDYGKLNSIRLEQIGNNIKAHAEFKEISQELLD